MNKICAKTVNKKFLVIASAVMLLLLVAAILVSALVGVNYGAGIEDTKSITVTVNSFVYKNNLEDLEEICQNEFDKQEISVKYTYCAEMSGDNCEVAYVFGSDVDDQKIAASKKALTDTLKAEVADVESPINGAIVNVASNSEIAKSKIASRRLWRSVIATAVFAVLAFVYVAIRYRVSMGFVAGFAPIFAAALATSIVLLAQIPVTSAIFYAILVAALLAEVCTLMTLNKIRVNAKSEEFAGADAETLIKNSIAGKEILLLTAALGGALVLVGAIATAGVRYFAIASLIGVLAAAFIGLIYVPALYLPMKACADKKAAQQNVSGYVGAKKEDEE